MSYRHLFSLLAQKIAESEPDDTSKKLHVVLSGSIPLGDTAILDEFISTYSNRLFVGQTDGREPTDYKDEDETAVYYVKLDSMEIYRDGTIIAQIAPPKVVMTPPPAPYATSVYHTTSGDHESWEPHKRLKGTPPVADTFNQDGKQIGWRGTHQDQERRQKAQESLADFISAGGPPRASRRKRTHSLGDKAEMDDFFGLTL